MQRGFSLVELLVVLGIISILIGLLLPAIHAARESARMLQCQNNLKQIGLALSNYESAHQVFPAAAYGEEKATWLPGLLPYLELGNLAEKYDFNSSYGNAGNQEIVRLNLSFLRCPSDSGDALKTINNIEVFVGSYFPCSGTAEILVDFLVSKNQLTKTNSRTMFAKMGDSKWIATKAAEITDGLSNTIAFGEVHQLSIKNARRHRRHTDLDPYIDLPASPFDPASVFLLHGAVDPSLNFPGPEWNITNGMGGDAEFYSEHQGGNAFFLNADGSVHSYSRSSQSLSDIVRKLSINGGSE